MKKKLPELQQRPDFPRPKTRTRYGCPTDVPHGVPNPFLAEFVEHHGRPNDPDEPDHRKPFAVDVSAGKTDPLYRARLPHQRAASCDRPFCGSGMTGVAAQWCGTPPPAYRRTLKQRWKSQEREPPAWGARRVVLGDLSPAATFIAANYNIPFDVGAFDTAAGRLLAELEAEVG